MHCFTYDSCLHTYLSLMFTFNSFSFFYVERRTLLKLFVTCIRQWCVIMLLRNVERYQQWHSVAAVTQRRTDDIIAMAKIKVTTAKQWSNKY